MTYLELFLWILAYPPLLLMTDYPNWILRSVGFAMMTVGLIRFSFALFRTESWR